MLSDERPDGNIAPAAGFLTPVGVQPFAQAQGGLREDFRTKVLNPT
jgi:hypothetical protein